MARKWRIERRATVWRYYEVIADSEEEAKEKSSDIEPSHEEDDDEETISITEVP